VKGTQFHFREAMQTLRARPGLSVLAILLWALALWLCAAILGTLLLLHNLRTEILKTLAADIELSHEVSDAQRNQIASLARRWRGVAEVSYISPDSALQVYSAEAGENLEDTFGGNPFPPVLRVRFDKISLREMDSLAAAATRWDGVTDVVYPRELLRRIEELAGELRSRGVLATLGLLVLSLAMVALVLRAQFAGRRKEWRLLTLLGMTNGGVRLIAQIQATTVGIIASIIAAIGLYILGYIYSIVFLEMVYFPAWFCIAVLLGGIVAMFLVGFAIVWRRRIVGG
jgi:cell division transport system permease protein